MYDKVTAKQKLENIFKNPIYLFFYKKIHKREKKKRGENKEGSWAVEGEKFGRW